MDGIALALFFGLVVRFVLRAWKPHGRLSGRDRWAVLTAFIVALTMFAVAPLVINWVLVPAVIWLIAVALLSGGVIGAALRWPELAWFSGAHSMRRAIGVAVTLLSCALIIAVALP